MAIDAAKGMEYLHSLQIMHRDLKSKNMLVDRYNNVKLCDFGLCKVKTNDLNTGGLGTISWMAPEVLSHENYSEKADVYSFGVILWELLTCEEPFNDVPIFSVPVMVTKGERPPIPKDCPSLFKKLIKSCWSQSPKSRPDFKNIIQELTKASESLKARRPSIDALFSFKD